MWMRHLSPCLLVWFRGGGADADDARLSNADRGRRNDLCAEERISSQGLNASQLRCAVCDREPGAVRLAAVELEEADE